MATAEGRILTTGITLAVVYLAGLGIGWPWLPEQTQILGAMTALNLLIGRAAGMSFGYASGLGHAVVIPANMLIETIQVFIVFPLFVFSWTHLLEIRALKAFMSRMQKIAETRREVIRSYGIVARFLFVFTPFWMTGPAVGSIVGFLVGLRTSTNMSIVLSGTYLAIGVWALLLRELTDWAVTYNRYALFGLVIALAVLVIAQRLLQDRFGQHD